MKKMEFGMPTLLELDTLEECIALCRELDLSFVELNMNLPQYQLDALDTAAVEKAISQGVGFTIHLDEKLDVCDMNPLVAEAYLKTVLAAVETAKRFHMPVLNMHMADGIYFTLPDRKIHLYEKYRSHYLDRSLRFREACTKTVGNSGIKIAVENCGGYTAFQREAIDLLLESPTFVLTLDIGHSHAAGDVDEAFILRRKNCLSHMHIHDALGRRNHLPLWTGEIDLFSRLSLARETGSRCVLEIKTVQALRASVAELRRRWHD